jgi:hypothetical protein
MGNVDGSGQRWEAPGDAGPLAWIPLGLRGRIFTFLATLTVILLGVQMILDRPLAPNGIVALELAGSPERAGIILLAWGNQGTVTAAFGLGLDYLFAVAYALTLAMACQALAGTSRGGLWRRAGIWLAWASLAAGTFDILENTAMAPMLLEGRLDPWAPLATGCAVVKLTLVGLALVYVLAGIVLAAAGRSRA